MNRPNSASRRFVTRWFVPVPIAPVLPVVSVLLIAAAVLAGGCGPAPTKGGTAGRILSEGQPISEIQVTVYRVDGSGARQSLGIGVPRPDGTFQLVTLDASGPLELPAGDYCCTIESIGAPVVIPREYQSSATTPLKVTWPAATGELTLEIPALTMVR